MDLTIQQQCGSSANISNGVLSITLAEIGVDTNLPTSSQILGALILIRHNLMSDTLTNDPSVGIVVGDPFFGLVTRGTQQQAEQQYSVSLYKNVSNDIVTISDPDDIAV